MSEWRRFGSTDPVAIKGINCAVFRFKRKKFTVARLEWCEAHPDDRENGKMDEWMWITDYGVCHEIDVEDRWIALPMLELTIEKKY